MLRGKFTVQFPLYSITSTMTSVKPRKACFNHILLSVVLLSFSLIIFFTGPWAGYSNSQTPDREKYLRFLGQSFFTACDKDRSLPIIPFLNILVTPVKWPTVTQSLLKAGLLSQRFLAVAALALRAHYPLVYWGKNKSPAAMTKSSFFFQKNGVQ